MSSSSILIKNANVVTLDPQVRVLKSHDILIEADRIKAIGKTGSLSVKSGKVDTVIEADNKVVMPGFINAHTHFYSTFARGLTKTKSSSNFHQVLKNLWWPLDRTLNHEECYYSAIVMLMEAIRAGTTTVFDHHASNGCVEGSLDVVAKAVQDSGIRAALCYEISDRDGSSVSTQAIKENERFLKYISHLRMSNSKSSSSTNLKGMVGLHASFTIESDTIKEVASLAKTYNTGIHVHVAEDPIDQEITRQKYGCSAVERFFRAGLLNTKSIVAHGVHLDDQEIQILKDSEVFLAHNPESNMNNAVGTADISELIQEGVRVGIGTDAMTMNMPLELRCALLKLRDLKGDPSVGFSIITQMLQQNIKLADEMWGESLGTVSEGTVADLVIMRDELATNLSDENLIGHLLYSMVPMVTDTVIVGGKLLMRDGQFTTLDEQKIYAKSREMAKEVWRRI